MVESLIYSILKYELKQYEGLAYCIHNLNMYSLLLPIHHVETTYQVITLQIRRKYMLFVVRLPHF